MRKDIYYPEYSEQVSTKSKWRSQNNFDTDIIKNESLIL